MFQENRFVYWGRDLEAGRPDESEQNENDSRDLENRDRNQTDGDLDIAGLIEDLVDLQERYERPEQEEKAESYPTPQQAVRDLTQDPSGLNPEGTTHVEEQNPEAPTEREEASAALSRVLEAQRPNYRQAVGMEDPVANTPDAPEELADQTNEQVASQLSQPLPRPVMPTIARPEIDITRQAARGSQPTAEIDLSTSTDTVSSNASRQALQDATATRDTDYMQAAIDDVNPDDNNPTEVASL